MACGEKGLRWERGAPVVDQEEQAKRHKQSEDDLKYLTEPTDDWALQSLRHGVGRLLAIEADAREKIARAMQGEKIR